MSENRIGEIDNRIDKMGKWAAGIEAQLKQLSDRITVADCTMADAIAVDMSSLLTQRKNAEESRLGGLVEKGDLELNIATLKEDMETIEADTLLGISAEVASDGTEMYDTVSKRAAAVKVVLRDNEEYQELRATKRAVMQKLVGVKAMLAVMDSEAKEFGRKNDSLIARLNNLTARVK